MSINTITLQGMLPDVFVGEAPRESDIWLRDGVTFRRGDNYVVEADSGTGKSSLCAYIYGSRTDYQGTILFDGADVRTFSIEQWCRIRRTDLAYLPQEMKLFPELTALENVMIKNRLTDRYTEAEVREMLCTLELGDRIDTPAARLSVGQQQRVAIVRAVCQPYSFILVDEPVSHLDARNNAAVAALISESAASQGASVIATSVGNRLGIDHFTSLML